MRDVCCNLNSRVQSGMSKDVMYSTLANNPLVLKKLLSPVLFEWISKKQMEILFKATGFNDDYMHSAEFFLDITIVCTDILPTKHIEYVVCYSWSHKACGCHIV